MTFGKPRRGQDNGMATLTNAQAHALRARYRVGETSLRDLQRETGYPLSRIYRIVKGLSYPEGEP